MKQLLILLLLFGFNVSKAQTPAEIIGKSIKIGNLEIAQHDFKNRMSWDDAN